MARGGVFAYLGPNGAGKTPIINTFCGLSTPDARRIEGCGWDVRREPAKLKGHIGVVPDESNLFPELSCRRTRTTLRTLRPAPPGQREAHRGVAGQVRPVGRVSLPLASPLAFAAYLLGGWWVTNGVFRRRAASEPGHWHATGKRGCYGPRIKYPRSMLPA
ncbi:MAG: ATP-binding cassette domain-containing protein [Deltaproteobacteria bacterium]|nr:ATP-binding cassette domain-containing protein [Deltaproteobacteria bacterium]